MSEDFPLSTSRPQPETTTVETDEQRQRRQRLKERKRKRRERLERLRKEDNVRQYRIRMIDNCRQRPFDVKLFVPKPQFLTRYAVAIILRTSGPMSKPPPYVAVPFPDHFNVHGVIDGYLLLRWLLTETPAYVRLPKKPTASLDWTIRPFVSEKEKSKTPFPIFREGAVSELAKTEGELLYPDASGKRPVRGATHIFAESFVATPKMHKWEISLRSATNERTTLRVVAPIQLSEVHPYFNRDPRPLEWEYIVDAMRDQYSKFIKKNPDVKDTSFKGFKGSIKSTPLVLRNDCWVIKNVQKVPDHFKAQPSPSSSSTFDEQPAPFSIFTSPLASASTQRTFTSVPLPSMFSPPPPSSSSASSSSSTPEFMIDAPTHSIFSPPPPSSSTPTRFVDGIPTTEAFSSTRSIFSPSTPTSSSFAPMHSIFSPPPTGSPSETIGDFISSKAHGGYQRKKWQTRADASTKYNIVLRDVSFLDIPDPPLKVRKGVRFVAAYYPHAYGQLLGYISFHPNEQKIYQCSTKNPDDRVTVMFLVDDARNHMRKSTEISIGSEVVVDSALIGEVLGAPSIQQLIGNNLSPIIKINDDETWTLEILCTIDYRPLLAGGEFERPHGLFIYLSRSYCSSEPIFIPAGKAKGSQKHRLLFKVSKPYLAGHALLNIDSYALFENELHEDCVNQSGYTNMRLCDLPNDLGKPTHFLLHVPNSRVKRVKGNVVFVCHSINLPIQPNLERRVDTTEVRHAFQQSEELIDDYIKRNRDFYKMHPPTADSVRNVTVFTYAGRKGHIPGCLFDTFRIPKSIERYYLTALQIAYRRRNPFAPPIAPEIFAEQWSTIVSDEQSRILIVMDMLCIYVNYCTYITDIVDNNDGGGERNEDLIELIESFDMVRPRDTSDCEDFSKETITEAMEIKHNIHQFQSKAMLEVRRILSMFVIVSALCGVSKNAISHKDTSSRKAKLNGHECAIAIPNYIFFKALGRSNNDHPLLTLYNQEERELGRDQQIYVLEGTGNLFPEPREKTPEYKDLVARVESHLPSTLMEVVGRQFFYHPDHPDNFYKKIITLMTPTFFLEKGYRGFEFLVCIEGDEKGVFMRGVNFVDLLRIDSNLAVRIFEAPTIDPLTFRAATRIDDDNFPPTTLEPIQETASMLEVARELTTHNVSSPSPKTWMSLQIRFDEMTPTVMGQLKSAMNALHLNMKVLVEPVKLGMSTKKFIGGYTIIVY